MDELGKKILEPMSKMVKLDRGDFSEMMNNKDKIESKQSKQKKLANTTKTPSLRKANTLEK
jgi:hypothetical protein